MIVRFQISDAEIWIGLLKAPQECLWKIEQEECQVGSIGHGCLFDVHKIFQTPILFGVLEIEFDLEAQAVELDEFVLVQLQICAEKNDVRLGLGV